MLVGLNPAGRTFLPPTASSEAGNAFRPDVPVQLASQVYARRVCRLFQAIADALGEGSAWRSLMDETLTSNFCPFRSRAWPPEHRTAETVAFSQDLWRSLCAHLRPRVLLCLGKDAQRAFTAVYEDLGFCWAGASRRMPTGWGRTAFTWQTLISGEDRITIVGIPHPSYFFIVGNPKFYGGSEAFSQRVAACLRAGA